MLEKTLAVKKAELGKQVLTQGLPHARLWGHAYPGWILSEGPGLGPSDKGEPGGCTGTWGPNQEPCGMACLPLSTLCHECILNDPSQVAPRRRERASPDLRRDHRNASLTRCVSQTLYTKDPDRGRPVMRNPSAAQINRLHQSEQLKAEELIKDAHGLSLDTCGLLGAGGAATDATHGAATKISTPDRHIAANLLAACFPHAKKERRESSAASKEPAAPAAAAGTGAVGAADAHSAAGSSSAALVAAKPPNAAQVINCGSCFVSVRGIHRSACVACSGSLQLGASEPESVCQ
jgi:hypothetical protein